MNRIFILSLLITFIGCNNPTPRSNNDDLFRYRDDLTPRWVSFENNSGDKGKGGMENNGGKGHPSDGIEAGESKTFLDMKGPGIINRMWFTINDRSPEMLRGLIIEIYWDNEEKPAVSAPFGDFFGVGVGKTAEFDNALFANPEGRSFNSFVQMPFKTSARIVLTNETKTDLPLVFYDINLNQLDHWSEDLLYFHCYWHRDTLTTLTKDFEILPRVNGKGRFLGSNISVTPREEYNAWWGEGEVKVFLNGDTQYPTLIGTGTEDYIGTAWGQGIFHNDFSGCLVASQGYRYISFYRYHIPDPIYFKTDCKVTMQQIGGKQLHHVRKIQNEGVKLVPTTVNQDSEINGIYRPGSIVDLDSLDYDDNVWVNFYRVDDVAAAAYFYLDKPASDLPPIQSYQIRTWNLPQNKDHL